MEDISRKIESLLSDEESMRQIQELAAMFSGGEFSGSDNTENSDPPTVHKAKIRAGPESTPLRFFRC